MQCGFVCNFFLRFTFKDCIQSQNLFYEKITPSSQKRKRRRKRLSC